MSKPSNKIYILSFFLFFLLRCFDINAANLSYEERLVGQKSIEAVYWKHRLWPAENNKPKPQFEDAVSAELIRSKVDDALRKSAALEEIWKRPLLASQLQAEMERIVKETKDPRMLQELFDALGNDPERIAECLARPILADRLIRNWYGYGQRFHGELRWKVEKELSGVSPLSLSSLSGEYQEMLWRRSDFKSPDTNAINPSEWNALIQKLTDVFQVSTLHESKLPVNQTSKLQENESEFYAMTILERSEDSVKIGSVRWKKTSFEKWWAESNLKFLPQSNSTSFAYKLPVIDTNGGSCTLDTWSRTPSPPIGSRFFHSAVWTGTEMIIWGGSWLGYLNDGGKYDPATDTWTPTTLAAAPAVRRRHNAVWTGSEMIVWGGQGCIDQNSCPVTINTGGRYNPANDTWQQTDSSNAPPPSYEASGVWTGSEMIIWGGISSNNTPWRYDPTQDLWSAGSTVNAPSAAIAHVAVWTGTEMIVWGGTPVQTGKRYNPQTDQWITMSTSNSPPWAFWAAGIWSGTEMIVWGGQIGDPVVTGGRYNPLTNSWTQTNVNNAPAARFAHKAVWTGNEMIVWGGVSNATTPSTYFNDGGRYDPNTDSWTSLSLTNAPSKRYLHTAVWSGNEMIVFGGIGGSNTGGRYDPSTDTWVPTNTSGLPIGRWLHTAVWTGTEMIVWGGNDWSFDLNSGGAYDPAVNLWSLISDVSIEPRSRHTAIWTGTEMIVWGGDNEGVSLNTGARFNPITMQWNLTSTTNAPETRYFHSAIWTGSEMIVWGGQSCPNPPSCSSDNALQTGGHYDPFNDQWIATSMSNAPPKRGGHSAVWTGTEMIIWGGESIKGLLNTGSRYDPNSQTWNATSIINAPSGRNSATSVWTGSHMIIWSGSNDTSDGLNTGGVYNPSTDVWTATATLNAPSSRYGQAGVWTGQQMVVWGGQNSTTGVLDTGGIYDIVNDSWSPTSMINPPPPTSYHSAVWTGTHMIVWGGWVNFTEGGLYCLDPFPIVANPDFYDIDEDQNLFISAPGVLTNDTDPEGDPLSAVLISTTTHGTLTLNADGSFQYLPDPNFFGTDSFGYYATDGNGGSDSATVTLTINPINDPPVAQDDAATTQEETSVTVSVLANDSDIDNDPLSVINVTSPANGITVINADNTVTYTPNVDFFGTDNFQYTLQDTSGATSTANVTVTVTDTAECMYCDDFEDGVLDSNWTYKRTWNENSGSLNGNGTSGKASAIASPVFAGCTNCTADFVIQSSGGSLSKVWMFGWYIDKKNSIELLIKEDKDKWILRDRFNGVVVSKFKVSQEVLPNVVYNVRMTYDGNQIQVFVDDFQNAIITFVPTHTVSPGTIGLKVVNTDVSLQNISVY